MNPVFDAHCHSVSLVEGHLPPFCLFGGVDPQDWKRQIALCSQHPTRLFPVFGHHPWALGDPLEIMMSQLRAAISDSPIRVVGIGETGLDHSKRCPKESFSLQQSYFSAQVALAQELKLPLVLHVVHAHSEAITLLKETHSTLSGIVHRFIGDLSTARKYLDLGLKLSIHPQFFDKHGDILKQLPDHSFVLESDATADAKCDTEAIILQSAEKVSQITNKSVSEVLHDNTHLIRTIFDLK